MDQEDNSSEGILGSSDDEIYDGLSEAVSHHFEEQEYARHQFSEYYGHRPRHWGQEHDDGFRHQQFLDHPAAQYNENNHACHPRRIYNHNRNQAPQSDYQQDVVFPNMYRSYSQQPLLYGSRLRFPLHDVPRSVPNLPPLAFPRKEYIQRRFKPPNPSYRPRLPIRRQYSPPSNPEFTRFPSRQNVAPLDSNRGDLGEERKGGNKSMLNNVTGTAKERFDFNKSVNSSERPESNLQDVEMSSSAVKNSQGPQESVENVDASKCSLPKEKVPLKPIAFQIKANTVPQLPRYHPLDPFFSPISKTSSEPSSPEKWSHDKYSPSEEGRNVKEKKEPPLNSSEPIKKNIPKDLNKSIDELQPSPSNVNVVTATKEENINPLDKKLKRRKPKSIGKSKPKRKSRNKSRLHQKENEDALQENPSNAAAPGFQGCDERDEEILYEEIIEEIAEEDVPSKKGDLENVDDEDEELLGLRLVALNSALRKTTADENEKSQKKSSSKSRKKVLQRVMDRKRKTKSRKSRNRSNLTESFLKKYSAIANNPSPKTSHQTNMSKFKPEKRLTLVNEIMKNQKISVTDAFHKSRSSPSTNTTKSGKPDELQAFGQSTRDGSISAMHQENVAISKEQDDNYEEIEMDLVDDEEEILHPPAARKALVRSEITANEPIRSTQPADSPIVINSSSSMPDISTVPATPTQESIWNMLENPDHDADLFKSKDASNEEKHAEDKTRNTSVSSEEKDIDDDALLILRAALLQQLEKSPRKNTDVVVPEPEKEIAASSSTQKDSVLFHDEVLMPLEYPYQPPTLQDQTSSTIFQRRTHSLQLPVQAFPHSPQPPPAIENPSHDKPPIWLPGTNGSTTTYSAPKTHPNVIIHKSNQILNSPTVFQPNLVSTPLLPEIHKNGNQLLQPQTNRQRRKKRRRRNSKTKLQHMELGREISTKGTNQMKNTIQPERMRLESRITNTPKSHRVLPSEASNVATSQVVFKSATTLIKNRIGSKRLGSAATSSHLTKRMRVVSHPASTREIVLPRHQPVVISLQDSSDEEFQLEERKNSVGNVGALQLDEMIRTVRQQTNLPKSASTIIPPKSSNEQVWPFVNPRDGSQSSAASQEGDNGDNNPTVPNKYSAVIKPANEEAEFEGEKNIVDDPAYHEVVKSTRRPQQTHHRTSSTESVHCKRKHIFSQKVEITKANLQKLATLIIKDKISHKCLKRIKHEKEIELRTLRSELQRRIRQMEEMKKKVAECEGNVKRYTDKGMNLRRQLDKRNKLKLKLEKRLKMQLQGTKLHKQAPQTRMQSSEKDSKTREAEKEAYSTEEHCKNPEIFKQPSDFARTTFGRELSITNQEMRSRRMISSHEVRSHLDDYKKKVKTKNPSAHDLSLSKISISANSPVRSTKADQPDDETQQKLKMKKAVYSHFNNIRQILQFLEEQTSEQTFHCKFWDPKIPDCFKTWKIDVGDLAQSNQRETGKKLQKEFHPYESCLRSFRSYRFSPFLRTKEGIPIKSKTFSHKIDAERILCRYDITGTCNDAQCKAQHFSDFELDDSELVLDLISYCPMLLGDVKADIAQEELIKLSDAAAQKLCGMVSARNPSMSIEEMCVLITSKVNMILGNKAPSTTIFKPRMIRPKQITRRETVLTFSIEQLDCYEETYPNLEVAVDTIDCNNKDPDWIVSGEDRYYVKFGSKGSIGQIEHALKKNQHSTQFWIQLANKQMQVQPEDQNETSLDLALHTMCLALEENPHKGELWAHYLGFLKHRKEDDNDQYMKEMISQAVELVPLSPQIWNQIFSMKSSRVDMEHLYDKLIMNLLKYAENPDNEMWHLTNESASRWLLQTILQRTQFHLLFAGPEFASEKLEVTVKEFTAQCNTASSMASSGINRCLCSFDLCLLWLALINMKYFNYLPSCFLPDSIECANVIVKPNCEVKLHFDAKVKLSEKVYSNLHIDLIQAILVCSQQSPMSMCVSLFQELVRLEVSQGQLESAISTCSDFSNSMMKSLSICEAKVRAEIQTYLTETRITWADILVRINETVKATQLFDTAVTEHPSNARLCYEASLYQLNEESQDVDAALLYFETCARAYVQLDEEGLDAKKLLRVFRFLLRIPTQLNEKFPLQSGIDNEFIEYQKPYLFLIYCLLMELCKCSINDVIDSYEQAISDTERAKDREQIWLRYLKYRLSLAPTQCKERSSVALASKCRQSWFRIFTAVVRRCLLTSPTRFSVDDAITVNSYCVDYSFHNKVVDLYLSCLHPKQQVSAAYSMFTDLMPNNTGLLLSACKHFLSFGDTASVIAILWKPTSNTTCQNKMIWKISIASHYARGRIAKAIRLSRRSVEAMPYCRDLWADYLNLLQVHATVEDLNKEKARCRFHINPDYLLYNTVT